MNTNNRNIISTFLLLYLYTNIHLVYCYCHYLKFVLLRACKLISLGIRRIPLSFPPNLSFHLVPDVVEGIAIRRG